LSSLAGSEANGARLKRALGEILKVEDSGTGCIEPRDYAHISHETLVSDAVLRRLLTPLAACAPV
jgi:hypothetical protein